MKFTHRITVAVTALALAAAPAALAKKGGDHPGKGQAKSEEAKSKGKGHGKGKSKAAKNIVVKGSLVSIDTAASTVVVLVEKSNKHGRHLVGTEATFPVAKFSVGDTDGDTQMTLADFAVGDKVLVNARKGMLVNQTNPEVEEDEVPATEPAPEVTPTEPTA